MVLDGSFKVFVRRWRKEEKLLPKKRNRYGLSLGIKVRKGGIAHARNTSKRREPGPVGSAANHSSIGVHVLVFREVC